MTVKNKMLSGFLIALFLIFSSPLKASALDIPLLTWERGKEQNIILGGQTQAAHWNLTLVGSNSKPLRFSASIPNAKGFIVYSVTLPLDLTLGAYSIQASAPGNASSIVAGVRVTDRNYYSISQIPTDLRLLVILYAILISSFSVIRGRKYRKLSFKRDLHRIGLDPFEEAITEDLDVSSKGRVLDWVEPLYRFRQRRISSLDASFMKFIAMKDGEALHKLSPNAWAFSPFIGILLGVFTALKIQGHSAIPVIPIWTLILLAVLGSFDAIFGMAASIGFAAIQIGFGDINSIRSLLILIAFTFLWYGPSMLASMYLLTLPKDFSSFAKLSNRIRLLITYSTSALLGSITVILSAILTDSLVINQQGSKIARFPLAIMVLVSVLIKNFVEWFIERNRQSKSMAIESKIEELELARAISPGFAFTFTVLILGLIYVWTQSWSPTLIGTALIGAPLFLLFMAFPEFASKRIPKVERNVILEVLVVGILTTITYLLIQLLPMGVIQKSKTFILLGVIPVLLHAIYSVLIASSERVEEWESDLEKEGDTA